MSIIKKSLSDEREEQKAESSSRSICCYWSLSLDEISVLQCRYTNIGGKLSQEIFIVEVTAFFGDLSHADLTKKHPAKGRGENVQKYNNCGFLPASLC